MVGGRTLAHSEGLGSTPPPESSSEFRLGPGLITGAADDDPSGIASYSQAGAQFGMGLLWTMLFTFPLMAGIQEICARLGRITGHGVAANLRKHYPKQLLYAIVLLLCAANILNLGADITAMGAGAQLLFGGNSIFYSVAFGLFSVALQFAVPYRRYVHYLKWLTLVLFAYVATAFVVHVPWMEALHATIVPRLSWSFAYWMTLVAVLGTTISPYLFFWQTSEEVEEVRVTRGEWPLRRQPWRALAHFRRIALDTRIGMAFSNLIAFFIILSSAVTLHAAGSDARIATAADAAKALEPLAGRFAFLLFSLGIIGTGLLAIPVLTGSTAYAVAETFRWRASLQSKPRRAPGFYLVIAVATMIGLCLSFAGLDPLWALYCAAVFNGIVAVPLMAMLMMLCTNRKVLGKFTLPRSLQILGWIATGVMFVASAGFLIGAIRGWT